MSKEIILVGDFLETIELCELCNYHILGIIAQNSATKKDKILDYPVLGRDADAKKIYNCYGDIPVIISPDKPAVRKQIFDYYNNIGFSFETLISPKAYISPSAQIGKGCIIQSFCNISTNANIGNFVKINTYANIMHDCILEDYVTVAPNAVILGSVKIGSCSYIGANSTIIQTKQIQNNAVIGAGAVVTKNIVEGDIVAGVPAVSLKGKKELM